VNDASVIVLIADGVKPGLLEEAVRSGDVPELAALRDESGLHVVTTVFPSVTGVAYIPFLTGLHPAEAGIPGLRWYDRSRRLPRLLGHSRSYVGTQIRAINQDLSPTAVTAFERVRGDALGCASMITRGLPSASQLDRGARYAARVIRAHVTGSVERWSALEEELAGVLVERVRREKPKFVFASFTAGDKAIHAGGPSAPAVRRSLRLVDHVAASIRRDAERDGRWGAMRLFVVSDHGHSPVHHHMDLAVAMRDVGITVRAHPWTFPDRSEAAVMVSGNCMAHVYLGLDSPAPHPWPALRARWEPRIAGLMSHPAIDLIAMRSSPSMVEVRRGLARGEIEFVRDSYSYRTTNGNPLGLEPFENECERAAHERTVDGEYPDGVRQLARLVLSQRSGDLVISASPGWDLRRKYEPINHVSSHGALHAAHMKVPLLCNRRFDETPRETADLFRLSMAALGLGERRPLESTFAGASGR
jgi:hypothetical protein